MALSLKYVLAQRDDGIGSAKLFICWNLTKIVNKKWVYTF
ncbi:hypothetical protein LAC1533_1297 [Ligilactobacillus acidipiscis]|uniref:Uncharacterized protein n=1 Tax=Ligilactobacillus acidipiscis TaxID=89059 RepID=A0A1K1KPH1_9LACO|nr:hypothetical protein LAC1533_1297 [Ligilactobacillus acidipiscis]